MKESAHSLALALLLSVFFGTGSTMPALAQSATPDLEICTIFPVNYLRDCGGRGPSMEAKWFGPESSQSFASIGTLLPELLPAMRETQEANFQNFMGDSGATGEMRDLNVKGCTQVRVAMVTKNGAAIMVHGTGLCFGYTVNFYALNESLASGADGKFVTAIGAVGRDLMRR